jgi:hypothetical protein
MGAVEITASSVYSNSPDCAPRNAADFGTNSEFCSEDKPGQWICWDFKALRIEPRYYTIRTSDYRPNYDHLKSWAVEGSDEEFRGRNSTGARTTATSTAVWQ